MDNLFAHILDSASRAPSAHNTQPWLLKQTSNSVELWLSDSRTLPFADSSYNDVLHGIGACMENIRLTLEHFGFLMKYEAQDRIVFDKPLVYIAWEKLDTLQDSYLYRMIPIRRTSRLPYEAKAIPDNIIKELYLSCPNNLKLYITNNHKKIKKIQYLTKEATFIQFEDINISKELYGWLRFSKKDKKWYRDGLNATCLGLNKFESLTAKYLLRPSILKLLCNWNLHKIFFSNVNQHAPRTSTICLLTMQKTGVASRIQAGMVLQKIWLIAASHGLATHPLSVATDVQKTCTKIKNEFAVSETELHVNLFRIGFSKPCARSSRLPVEEIIKIAGTEVI